MDKLVEKKAIYEDKGRNSNIEWLRIISMLLIIAFHATRQGYISADQPLNVYVPGILLGSWGILGVDLFLIISAWFLTGQKFRSKKVLSLVVQVFMYVTAYTCLYIVYTYSHCHNIIATVEDFLKYEIKDIFQPLWAEYYWFVTSYFFMLFASPFLNRLLSELTRSQIKKVLCAFSFVLVYAQYQTSVVCDVFYFLYVYLMIGYMKRYGCKLIDKFATYGWCGVLILIVLLSEMVLYYNQGTLIGTLSSFIILKTISIGRHSIFLLLIGMLLFFCVLQEQPRYNRVVNNVATCTLGVYLFHEDHLLKLPNTINAIFLHLTRGGLIVPDQYFFVRYLLAVLFVFAVGTLVEWFRQRLLHKPLMDFLSVKYAARLDKIDAWFNNF